MKSSYASYISSKKPKKLHSIDHKSQTVEKHAFAERSPKQTGQTLKLTKQKGKKSLSSEHSSQEQELQLPTDTQHLHPSKEYPSSDIKQSLNDRIDYSPDNSINQLIQTKDFSNSSPIEKDCPYKVLNSLRFYSPKSSYGSHNPTLETEVDVRSTSILPNHDTYPLGNLQEPKSMFRKTYGKRRDNDNSNSLNHSDESIISCTRNNILDVPIENPLDVTIEEPSKFNVWIIDDSNLDADIRYVPFNFGVKVEDHEFGDVEDFEGYIHVEAHHVQKSSNTKTDGDDRDISNFVADVETQSIRHMKQVKDICGSSTHCYDTESSVKLNDYEHNMLFGDVEIEITNTGYSSDNRSVDPSTAVDEEMLLKNPNNMNSVKLTNSYVASNIIETSLMLNSQETNDSIYVTPSSKRYTRESVLRSRIEVKDDRSTKRSVESRKSRPFAALSGIKRTSLEFDKNNLSQTSSLTLNTRKSTLRSRSLGTNLSESPEVKNMDTCCSSSDNESYAAIDNNTSNPNDGINSQPLPRSITTSKSIKRSVLSVQDDFSHHTPSSSKDAKSTVCSRKKQNEDKKTKLMNTCSGNDTDKSVTIYEVTAPSTTNRNLGPELKTNGNDDSLFLSPRSSKHIKKSILQPKLEATDLTEHDRKSSLRSRSLEVRKSHIDDDNQGNILSRSLSCISQYEGIQKNGSLQNRSNMKNTCGKLGDAIILNNDKLESKKLMDKKILKVVVVPLDNMTMNEDCYDDIQNTEIGQSSSPADNKTTENNNLIESNKALKGMENTFKSSKEEQNCSIGITCMQTPKITTTDEKFMSGILKSGVNKSLLSKDNRKKIESRASSDFVSPRLKAKQLQQMGLISEDTSFAFYSTVDSVLAEIKVSQKQHKLNSQNKNQHGEVDERIGRHTKASNVSNEQTLRACVHDVITRIIENVAISSCNQNEDCHRSSEVTRNKRSGRKSKHLSQHQNSSQNCDALDTQHSFVKLTEGHQELSKNCDTVLFQNDLIDLEYCKSRLGSTANNQLVKLHDTGIIEEKKQKSLRNMSLEMLNESDDSEDSNEDSSNKKTSKLRESECNTVTLKAVQNKSHPQKKEVEILKQCL
nr:unnamed protein product [Callosobruchus analis]